MFPDYYSFLQVSSNASLKEIMNAYNGIYASLRPLSIDSSEASNMLRNIIEARIILSAEKDRARYDNQYAKFNQWKQSNADFHCADSILQSKLSEAKRKAKSEVLWLQVNVTATKTATTANAGIEGAKEGVISSVKAYLVWLIIIGIFLLIIILMGV
jgi:DnaJ-class molecular chaperone